ncbi:class I SAM-dependent methyltransferase [Saccharothrix sp. BKS2]|uniref:class I SAM-dependent DNA methyltransferase n=1 Tax=Saccharothrix sp. BKS2 TaxID=3064400 RepID=UPI0039E7E1B5
MDDVRDAYGRLAEEYAELAFSPEGMPEPDIGLVSRWAEEVSGRVVDAGCGPGHWTDFLRRRGCDVEGVDLVPRFVDMARSRFPASSFRVGRLDELGVPDRSLGGILSWYSIIHTAPEDVPRVLGEFARCLVEAGFRVEATTSRVDPGKRPYAAIVARRVPGV